MQRLGINTVRVYNLDGDLNHDDCASIFNAVGIYMLIDVNSPLSGGSLNRGDPGSTYNSDYLTRIFGIVEAFKNYPNTLGFFGGNEVINDAPSGQVVPPYLRAVTRDLKNYIAKHSTRSIPVGYSAAQVEEILVDTFEYLQCAVDGSNKDMSRIDFFGLNSYSWCGSDATFDSAGYPILLQQFGNTTIPVFFSEYGCNKVLPRTFEEVQTLYGPQMTEVMSGGLVYEFSQEDSNFGLVALYENQTAQLRTDYDNLQMQYNKLNLTLLQSGNSTATTLTPPTCQSSLITSSSFYSNFSIPSLPQGGQDLINNGISNATAINGKLVKVSQNNVPQKIYSTNGGLIQNLAIKPLANDQSNAPNGQDTSGSASASSSASGTSTAVSGTAASGTASPSATTKSGVEGRASSAFGLFAVVGLVVALFS